LVRAAMAFHEIFRVQRYCHKAQAVKRKDGRFCIGRKPVQKVMMMVERV